MTGLILPEELAEAALAEPVVAPVVDGTSAPVADGTEVDTDGDGPESSPSKRGFRTMITAIPQAVQSRSIAMNAMSFCFAEGPRGRTTIVGVFPRRGLSGRSGMRIVIWPGRAGANACGGVCGYATAGAADGCGPELGWAG